MTEQYLCVDLHVHTSLSPCASDEMLPQDIVKHALKSHIDVLAVTDHNSTANIRAVVEAAQDTELLVIPGMEIETREEVHMLTLFPDLDTALQWGALVYETLPPIDNEIEVFGHQIYFENNVPQEFRRLLLQSTQFSVSDVVRRVESMGGICIPAHIDRPSYSLVNTLGFIPSDLNIKLVEYSRRAQKPYLDGYISIVSSDAHHLYDLYGKPSTAVQVSDKCIKGIFSALLEAKADKVVIF